jgi:hypothetical protein
LPEKILLAAHQLEETGQSPFTAEVLIVRAWKDDPQTFGLKGFIEEYPDSNKVLSSIMGERGLTGRGWLTKMGQKLYSITSEGKHIVRRLLTGEPVQEKPVKKVRRQRTKISEKQDALLQALFVSTAYEKYRENRRAELTFADACRFWGITENLSSAALDDRLRIVTRTLDQLSDKIGQGSVVLRTGQAVGKPEINTLIDLHHFLEDHFSRHLNLLRHRSSR